LSVILGIISKPNNTAMPSPTLRIARPTNNLSALQDFYVNALGLQVIGSFADHAGYDGIMLGHPEYSWHLEFTKQHGVIFPRAPTKEHLLVFYFPVQEEWEAAVTAVEVNGGVRVESENPYWDVKGVTFEDPDGYRVVLQGTSCPVNRKG
jgi:catechol 2,3-dioxygenase-like lactoylglutathione lyase family enzyme